MVILMFFSYLFLYKILTRVECDAEYFQLIISACAVLTSEQNIVFKRYQQSGAYSIHVLTVHINNLFPKVIFNYILCLEVIDFC